MRYVALTVLLGIVLLLFSSMQVVAQSGKLPEINTRGACLNEKEFVGLIKQESRKMKSGENLRLIIDIPNEKEARQAIKTVGYPIVKEVKDANRDLIDFTLEVKK